MKKTWYNRIDFCDDNDDGSWDGRKDDDAVDSDDWIILLKLFIVELEVNNDIGTDATAADDDELFNFI